MATGRTIGKYTDVFLDDSGGTLRQLTSVTSIDGLGLAYDEIDLTALNDAAHGALPGHPDCTITINGQFDNTATSGDHTVLSALNGLMTPLSFDVQIGIRSAWQAGNPQFGISSGAADGFIVTSYTVTPGDPVTYTATLKLYPGSALPAWGIAAET